jgi:hypothetical protein
LFSLMESINSEYEGLSTLIPSLKNNLTVQFFIIT